MQVRVFEVRTEEGFVGMVSIAPTELGFTKGLRSEAVMGTVPAGTNQILPSNFTVNPVFVRFLHDFIAKHTPTLPEFLAEAQRHQDGWVYIIDYRTGDVNGDVPPEDLLGAFEVKSGEPLLYHSNPNYRLFTERGFFVLHPQLEARLLEEIEALD